MSDSEEQGALVRHPVSLSRSSLRTRLRPSGPWLLNAALGGVAGLYTWQFLATNVDFTGPLALGLPAGLALTLLAGPLAALAVQSLSALLLARLSHQSFAACFRQDALSLLPLGLLGLSPLAALPTGWHSTAYNAAVVVLVSLSFSGCLALKAATAWRLGRASGRRLGLDARAAQYILAGTIAAYALLFSTLQVLRYNAYQLWGVDHTMVTQALWNTLHGRFLSFTFVAGTPLNLLADHFELVQVLLVPLYGLWSDPRLPLIVQVVVLALAAWPLYHMALRRLHSPTLALGWALVYLLLPMTIVAAQDSAGAIRADTLAIPIFVFMLDALDRKDWGILALTVALAFSAKEYLSLLVAMLGLYIALRQRRRALGSVLFVLGLLWFVALMQWIMPALRSGPNATLAAHFGAEAGDTGLTGLAQSLLQEPGQLLAAVFSRDHLLLLFFWLFTFAGLPVLDPLMAAASAPIFAIFALAAAHAQGPVNLGNHRYYPAVPFLLAAAINGLTTLASWVRRRTGPDRRPVAVALTAFALGMSLSAGFFWTNSPWSWQFWARQSQSTYWGNQYVPGEHARLADELIAMIPAQAPVLASDYLLAHLANRPQLYHFFWPPDDVLQRVDYAVADLLQGRVRTEEIAARERDLLRTLLDGPAFALATYEDGLLFFQRGAADGYTSQAELLAGSPQPQVRLEADLGGRLRLIGYDPPAGPLRAGERCRVAYYWQVLDGFAAPFEVKPGINPQSAETHQSDYVLADRFVGPAGEFRVLHLPTVIQLPPAEWQPGQTIRETFDFRLPAGAHGAYRRVVGLYVIPSFLGIQAIPERQVPGAEPIALDTLTVQP